MDVNDELRAWLRLALIPGLGGESQRKLLQAFAAPETIFAASRSQLRAVLPQKQADLVLDSLDAETLARIDKAMAWAAEPGNHILTLGDSLYPTQLLEIPDPPTLLYVRGKPELLRLPGLAVIGSRHATPQGLETARQFANYLAGQGHSVISGLALGIDTEAHRGALAAGGNTVAVIGTGADRLYPAQNKELALKIAEHGAILSEFPLGTPAMASNFPRRNRLISGLARGVLVVEAAVESGSLITARLAAEQGREVFAIPGSIHSPLARGCHRLIKQGAKLVETAQDILDELSPLNLTPPGRAANDRRPHPTRADLPLFAVDGAADVSTTARQDEITLDPILRALSQGQLSLDQLTRHTGSSAAELLPRLLSLELQGEIAPLPGNQYQRLR